MYFLLHTECHILKVTPKWKVPKKWILYKNSNKSFIVLEIAIYVYIIKNIIFVLLFASFTDFIEFLFYFQIILILRTLPVTSAITTFNNLLRVQRICNINSTIINLYTYKWYNPNDTKCFTTDFIRLSKIFKNGGRFINDILLDTYELNLYFYPYIKLIYRNTY